MNIYEVISQSWKISWKHKVLWLPGMCLALFSIFYLPISLLTNPLVSPFASGDFSNPDIRMVLIGDGVIFLLVLITFPVMIIAMIINTLGALHAKQGVEKLSFARLWEESLSKFWRVLGIFLIIAIGIFAVMSIIMSCMSIFAILTMGLGMLLFFPIIFIIFIPLAILVYAVEEFGIVAVVADNSGMFHAIKKGWEITTKNIGVIIMLCIIIYLIFTVAGIALSAPMLIPMYSMMSNVSTSVPDFQSFRNIFQQGILLMFIFSPFYIVFQGIALAFVQSIWTLGYTQLTKPKQEEPTPIALPTNA